MNTLPLISEHTLTQDHLLNSDAMLTPERGSVEATAGTETVFLRIGGETVLADCARIMCVGFVVPRGGVFFFEPFLLN